MIELIYDGKRTGNSVKFIDSGQKALGTLTLEEYNSVSGNHIIPKIIESKNDYLFAGNIKEQQHDLFEDYDARAYSFNPRGIAYLYDASGVNRVNVTSSTYDTVKPTGDCFNKYNDMSTEPLDDRNNFIDEDGSYCRYDIDKYYGGTGVNISWRFVTASLVGDANVSVLATGQYGNDRLGTSSICIDKNTSRSIDVTKPVVCKYLKYRNDNSSEEAQYDTSEYVSVSSSLSYSDAKTSMLFRSLRRDELYRYGIVLYHKNGSASNVKWIADIRTPNITWDGCETFHARGSKKEDFAEDLIVKPLGIEFDVRNLPEDCVGYEIVRCQRKESDIATISQGVISRPIAEQYSPGLASRPTTAGSIVYTPSGFITTNRYWTGNDAYARVHSNADSSGWEADNFENNTIYQFISPEVSYLKGSMKDFDNNVSLSLNPVKYIFGASSTTLGDTYNQYKTSLTYEGKKYRGIYPSAGNGRFACGYDTFVQSDDGQSAVYKTLTRDKAKSNVLFPTLCCKNDGVDIVNSLYKFRSSFELSREDGYGSTEAGKDDISTDSNGNHNQYTGVTPSRGNIYINSDGTLTRGVSFVMSYGNEGNVTDGGFQTVRDATYMYVKLYEQYSYVWSRVHNANHIGQAGYIKGDEAVGYVPVYRRINNGLKFAVKDSVIPKEFSWDDYASRVKDTANWTKSFNDKIDAIGNTNYCNYVSGGGFSQNIEAKDGDNFVRDC
nr:MAG TPA: stabilization protein [Caudoviricetes sp.]